MPEAAIAVKTATRTTFAGRKLPLFGTPLYVELAVQQLRSINVITHTRTQIAQMYIWVGGRCLEVGRSAGNETFGRGSSLYVLTSNSFSSLQLWALWARIKIDRLTKGEGWREGSPVVLSFIVVV